MKTLRLSLTALLACGALSFLPAASTPPVGFVTITCPANSDTIVGLPMRQNADFVGTISGAPAILQDEVSPGVFEDNGLASVTVSGTPAFTVDQYAGSYYIKFKDSDPAVDGDGQWFAVTENTADTITVDLNGGSIDAVSGAAFEVLKFWTLDELFPPGDCTTDPATTGNAIVASLNTLPFGRRTEVLYPNIEATGINGGTSAIYFVQGGIWKLSGDVSGADKGATQLWPDILFTIRHAAAVNASTTYTVTGEVEMGQIDIPLSSQPSQFQDNYVAIPRPVDVTLGELNLGGTSAFVSSTGTLPFQRGDELFVFDNTDQSINKGPTIYFYDTTWKLSGDGTAANKNDVVLPAGSGIVIRKKPNGGSQEATVFWQQNPSY